MQAGGGQEFTCSELLLTPALWIMREGQTVWSTGDERGSPLPREIVIVLAGVGVLPLGQTKPQPGRYFCISHMNKVMGETRTLTHHARAAAPSRMVLLAESYKHNTLAMAHKMLGHGAAAKKQGRWTFSNKGKGPLCLGDSSSTLGPFLADKICTAVTLQINVPSDECIHSDAQPSRG